MQAIGLTNPASKSALYVFPPSESIQLIVPLELEIEEESERSKTDARICLGTETETYPSEKFSGFTYIHKNPIFGLLHMGEMEIDSVS